ncbi:hypothetical protein HN51_063633 [Arachis hypogaea]|nr:Anthocyanidin 5,3-O-glucosyltransferase [Arachis hypogaea]
MAVPGCDYASFKVKDLPDLILFCRSGEIYTLFLSVCQKASLVDGIIVNTFNDLESEAMRALHKGSHPSRSIFSVGPIVAQPNQNQDEKIHECVAWLNYQLSKSMLYICFGSGGTLSQEQVNEIAFGLELSGHKFLWIFLEVGRLIWKRRVMFL